MADDTHFKLFINHLEQVHSSGPVLMNVIPLYTLYSPERATLTPFHHQVPTSRLSFWGNAA